MPNRILSVLLFIVGMGYSQITPYTYNFPLSDVETTAQSWDISKSVEGNLFVANGKGLLVYNGLYWGLFPLPNKTTMRSVLAVGSKVYTGSYQEFGYWEKDVFGNFKYHSITEDNENLDFVNEEFWQIISFQDNIIFRSFYRVYVYDGQTIQQIQAPSSVISLNVVDNKILVATLNHGIFQLHHHKLIPFLSQDIWKEKKIISIQALDEGKILICTELDGLYTVTNGHIEPWDIPIVNQIKKYQLNRFLRTSSGKMFFGTIQNGEYCTDSQGNIWAHFNRKNGLENNTILSQYFDENEQLWLGLDSGFSLIDLKSSNLFYTDFEGKLGTVYDVIQYENSVYIGSNTGLYVLNENGELTFVVGTQGHVWDLSIRNGKLLCGHNNGTFQIQGRTATKISEHAGGYFLKKVPNQTNMFIQGTYAGLVKFTYESNQWKVKHLNHVFLPIRYLEFEDQYTAWIAHSNKGLYKVKFSKDFNFIESIKQYESKDWSDYKLSLHQLKNEVVLKTNNGWYRYDPMEDTWKKNEYLNTYFGKSAYIASDEKLPYVVLKTQNYLDFRDKSDLSKSLFITDEYYKNRGLAEESKISYYNDSLLSINLKDGFMLINDAQLKKDQYRLESPKLDKIAFNGNYLPIHKNDYYEIPYTHNSLQLWFSSPKSERYFLEYAILNEDSLHWQPINGESLNFNHLFSGNNQLGVRTSNYLNQHSKMYIVQIEVSPPWFKSAWAIVLYTLLFGTILWLFYYLHKRKIAKEQHLLTLKLKQEQESKIREQQIENDKRLIALKNESLKKEVKHKSKELANNSMALIRKNESLMEIKEAIRANKNQIRDAMFYNKIIAKIEQSLKERKEEWELFENNFTQVHDDFFINLEQKHPNLKKRDLKLCAYIKMNLLTKEIAPLMNISTRGVETHKYRLKKKMNLDNDQSLSDYLMNIS